MAGTTPRTVRLQDLTVDVSLSGVAHGDLLFRGASKWNNLAAGTSGYYLKSNGADADPSWASVSLSPAGSSGQVQYNNAGSFGGAALLNYATSGTILTITDGATTDVPLVVNGVASQSGDLQQWKVNGSTKAAMYSSGLLSVASGASAGVWFGYAAGDLTGLYTLSGDLVCYGVHVRSSSANTKDLGTSSVPWRVNYTTRLNVANDTAGSIPVVVNGATSQSATLLQLQGRSSTTPGTAQAEVDTAWNDSTHATRSADLILRAYYTTTAREGLRIRGGSSNVQLGFFGAPPVSKPSTVSDPSGGATVDAESRTAIVALIDLLQSLGLMT